MTRSQLSVVSTLAYHPLVSRAVEIAGDDPDDTPMMAGWLSPSGSGPLRVARRSVGNQLQLNAIPIADPYAVWAIGGGTFDADTNGDGVDNSLAWLLGATHPSENATDKLPAATRNGGNLRLTFRCLKSTKRGTVQLKVQFSSDLGAADPWTRREAAVPDADSSINGVNFDITDGDFINVTADITNAGTKLFGRPIGLEP